MDLFVVERHGVETVASKEDEEAKLLKVMKRIEKRKRSRAKLKEKKEFQQKCIAERIKKKVKKAQIVKVPDVAEDEFIDKNLMSYESEKVPKNTEHKTESLEGYTVLGEEQSRKRPQVKRVLPKWLSNPTIISTNLKDVELRISDLKQLDKSLRKKLKANGICSFFPVQAAVIPWLLEAHRHADIVMPRDVCVSAPTGSGKTLAFVLPVIQALKQHTLKAIRALVVLPTQDLATQVFKTFRKYTLGTSLDVCLVAGHTPFATEQKHLVVNNKGFGYLSKADILVCTAGRLVDHIKYTNGFSLKHLKFLVIDEADRVLENVQNDWLYHLEKHLDVTGTCNAGKVFNLITAKKSRMPQKLLFSATLSQDPEKLEKLSLFQPKLFACTEQTEHTETEENVPSHVVGGKYVTPAELTEKYITSSLNLKPLVLYQFIKLESLTKTLIFTHSAESSHRLAVLLKQLFENTLCIEEVSASLDGKLRSAVINRFSNGEIDILVCTDALARGMDFTGVQCVISYSAPKHVKTYIHRVGRTARAGESGLAVTLLHESQMVKFAKILQQIGKPNIEKVDISEDSLESLAKQYESALENLKQTIYDEEQNQLRKIKKIKKTVRRKRNHQGQLKNDVQE